MEVYNVIVKTENSPLSYSLLEFLSTEVHPNLFKFVGIQVIPFSDKDMTPEVLQRLAGMKVNGVPALVVGSYGVLHSPEKIKAFILSRYDTLSKYGPSMINKGIESAFQNNVSVVSSQSQAGEAPKPPRASTLDIDEDDKLEDLYRGYVKSGDKSASGLMSEPEQDDIKSSMDKIATGAQLTIDPRVSKRMKGIIEGRGGGETLQKEIRSRMKNVKLEGKGNHSFSSSDKSAPEPYIPNPYNNSTTTPSMSQQIQQHNNQNAQHNQHNQHNQQHPQHPQAPGGPHMTAGSLMLEATPSPPRRQTQQHQQPQYASSKAEAMNNAIKAGIVDPDEEQVKMGTSVIKPPKRTSAAAVRAKASKRQGNVA